jgi:hypothetical protein
VEAPDRPANAAPPPSTTLPDDAFVVPRLSGAVQLDGRVDDAAWQAIEPLSVVMHYPTFAAPMTERTEFRVAYDAEYIYFSCRAYDAEPARILVYSLERDESGFASGRAPPATAATRSA